MFIIKKIEKKRIINLKKKKFNYIKYPIFIKGDFIIVWYISREREKGVIRFQFNRGICIDTRYKYYNSSFLIRFVIDGIAIEQYFLYFSLNNIYITLKKNIIKFYRLNKLYFLRKKKNKQSKFII
jgi:ribosomal protein L19